MALPAGTRLGVYEVTSQIGEGGMGQVYRATDTRLKRQVAMKVLPQQLAADADRMARFQREAEVLASLNHPNIAHIHGLEESGGTTALVMELVEGEDLSQRIARGAMPLDEALPIARQIAEALEAAHEQGIVHRDLKPANVKVRPDGTVKVLDFGLAKALAPPGSSSDVIETPTITTPAMTQAGMILGTAAYMSPEQAKGRSVDRRADIWAFGCVLFEMLTGTRAFRGDDVQETLVAIIRDEPDWAALPATLSPALRECLKRCLHKNLKQRIPDIGIVRLVLEGAFETAAVPGAAPVPTAARQLWTHALVFLLGCGVGAAALFLAFRPGAAAPAASARFNINLPRESMLRNNLQGALPIIVSPDATRIAYVGRRPDGRNQVFVRHMDRLTPEPVPGTEDAAGPFFSPDGAWLGFVSEGKLKKVPVAGGQPTVICDAPDARGASWGDDGMILLAPNNAGGLVRVPASGGTPVSASQPIAAQKEDGHRWPRLLPGGTSALISVQPQSGREPQRTIDAMNLATGQRKNLVQHGTYPVYAGGLLFFGRSGQILAAPFDVDRLELRGDPQPVLDDVRMDPKNTGLSYFDVSPVGTAVYVPGFPKPRDRELLFVDRQGRAAPVTATRRAYFSPAVSPDGRQIAVIIEGAEDALWVLDVASDTLNRLTFDMDVASVAWSPDGRSIYFSGNGDGPRSVYRIAADGSGKPELVFSRAEWWINDFSPNPRGSGVMIAAQQQRGHDFLFVHEGGQEAEPFLVTPSEERRPAFSPDGAFVAYQSNESGRPEAYVRPFPGPGPKRLISTHGGTFPAWSRDGREIFYWEPGEVAHLMRVPVEPGNERKLGKPQALFDEPVPMVDALAIMPDGQRFVMVKPETEEESPLEIVVIPGFLDAIKARLAGKRP